jgi:hypothetical protein
MVLAIRRDRTPAALRMWARWSRTDGQHRMLVQLRMLWRA